MWQHIFNQNKQQSFRLLFVLLLCAFTYLFGWHWLTETATYRILIVYYSQFVAFLTIQLAGHFGPEPFYIQQTGQIILPDNQTLLIMPVGSYKFYFVGILLLLLVPIKQYKSTISLVFFTVFFIAIRATVITSIHLLNHGGVHGILLLLVDPMIYIPMFFILLFVFNKNSLLKQFYDRILLLFKPILSISLPTLVFLLIVLTPISRVLLTYIDHGILDGLATITLTISKFLLTSLGYAARVSTDYLFIDQYWISLKDPCLGIGVISIVAILIASVKGELLNKILFLILFFVVFMVVNSIRLAALVVYIKTNYHSGIDSIYLHDITTYFMFFVAFVCFLGYYFWFMELKLLKK